ncbi:MAG: hypothetical protein EOO04_19700 [Chitinophagaceae bacterium]|nr:MAG: hypothetical protein EOO04_19700 [Chitinophagaceae bacterium]
MYTKANDQTTVMAPEVRCLDKIDEKMQDLLRIGWNGLVQNFGYRDIISLSNENLKIFLMVQESCYLWGAKPLSINECKTIAQLIADISIKTGEEHEKNLKANHVSPEK